MKKLIILAGLIAVLAVATSLWQVSLKNKNQFVGDKKNRPALTLKITKAADGAFGMLKGGSSDAGSNLAKTSSVAPTAPLAESATSKVAFGRGGGGVAGFAYDTKMMPPYYFKNYKFVYKGGEFSVEEKMDVLKRVKGVDADVSAQDLVGSLNFNLADLSSFSGAKLQSANFIERQDNGYVVGLFFDEGSMYISPNWETWPQAKCGNDQKCFEEQRVKENEILSKEEAVAIAADFLRAHNIDMSFYGDPEINETWRVYYSTVRAPEEKDNYYFPETVDINFPLRINDKKVVEEYNGYGNGLMVSVHNKTKLVNSVSGLTTQNYESSSYDMETDAKKIIGYAEKGGVANYMYNQADVKAEELELSDPELVYIRFYDYKDGKNTELLIPALSFPIVNPPQDNPNFYRKSVIVPLSKDILRDRLGEADGSVVPPIEPKPVDTGETTSTETLPATIPEPVLLNENK